jgi:hypothetical protein
MINTCSTNLKGGIHNRKKDTCLQLLLIQRNCAQLVRIAQRRNARHHILPLVPPSQQSARVTQKHTGSTHSNVCGAVDHISTISPVTNVSAASMLSTMTESIALLFSDDKNGNPLNCIASAPIVSHRLSWNAACACGGFGWSTNKSD